MYIALIALFSSFTVLLLSKVGALEWLQINGSEFISKLANCTFCLCFWISLILAIIVSIILKDIRIVLVPFFATPIARFLV